MADVQGLGNMVREALSALETCTHERGAGAYGRDPSVCKRCADLARSLLRNALESAEQKGWRPPSAF